ncbi:MULTISPECIES: LTA synthase family protein [unclassified Mesobacillus]|uniref:LTA synthase family protein n=1 Tax=unclassified Mesobacillus TaxID=2675270 RepID=UPI00203D6BD6|nr:LTA synthase family protein [Mesobacillus sp. MER 33]MCM3234042.1 LTA synthase family protein [Mesobacillus sp. MER 48]
MKKFSFLALLTIFSLGIKSIYTRFEILGTLDASGSAIEVSFLIIFFLLTTFLNKKPFLYLVLNIIGSFFLLTAVMYFDYYNSIFTYKSLAQAGQLGDIRTSIYALFKSKYLWFFSDILLMFLLWKNTKKLSQTMLQIRSKLVLILAAINIIFLSISFFRASQQISEINQYNTLGFFAYQLMEISSETGTIFRGERDITPELVASKKPSHLNTNLQLKGIAENKNLIIVQLESVQNFLLNKRIEGVEITPNLNRLIKESYYFPNFYTQVGKGNTSDAEFLVNSSIFALGNEPMSTAVAGKVVPSLPRQLKQAGYFTATFHANEVSFWSRKEMYEALGFEKYFDQDYFGKEDFIAYGVSDEILYKKTVEKLAELKDKKFYAHIIALSSHYPYDLPEIKSQYTAALPEEYNESIVGSYIKSVSYADYSFGILVEALKNSGLYENSIIVVYGDHQGVQTQNKKDTTLINELLGYEYHPILDHLNVPFIVKIPDQKGKTINSAGGLIDVYPTIANLMGLDLGKDVIFGTDLINATSNTIGIRFYAPTGTFVTDEYAYTPGKTNDSGLLTSISNRHESGVTKEAKEELKKIIHYMKLSDDYVRSFK